MTRGRVVLVAFPFDDRSAVKLRPAICLTEPAGPFAHITLAFVTSRPPAISLPSDLTLAASRDGFAATGLRATSVVRLHRLLTLGADAIERDLGQLSADMQADVDERLRALFWL